MGRISIETGRRIRMYRAQQHLSQEELAEKCGMHPTYIGQLERGEKNATLESISKVATVLSVSLSKLFENIEDFNSVGTNYPAEAYRLVQSVSEPYQKKLLSIIRMIIELNNAGK